MKKAKKIVLVTIFATLAIFVVAYGIGYFVGARAARTMRVSGGHDKLEQTLRLIEQQYVDPVDIDSLCEEMIPLLVEQLDPHSVYIPARDYAAANEQIEGEFDGIGVIFNMATDTIVVLNVIPGGPSDKAGVLNGDRIIRINDSLVAGQQIPQNDIVKQLRGARGTSVELGIARQGIRDLIEIDVERGRIPVKSIDAAFMVEPGVAFVKLRSFTVHIYTELMTALEALQREGMERLVLDLRGNGGGALDQVIAIANEFLPDGDMIVYTLDRDRNKTSQYSRGGRYTQLPLSVLIDEGSASASEILSGAIQDNDRGTIVGRRSFGKGLVQHQIGYSDGSALRLTVARYYTPTGRSVQKPYDNGLEEYEADLVNRFRHNEFFSADSIRLADSLKFTTPGGHTVYGGGGIMPDLFVPLDTMDITPYYEQVWGQGVLYKYTLEYTDRHRATINAIRSVAEAKAFLDRDTRLVENFIAYAARNGIAPDREQIGKSRALIEATLRAYIARNTPLEESGFFAMIYPVDAAMTTAVRAVAK